ncbi:hypothetical protein [Ligilactobacillus equi]
MWNKLPKEQKEQYKTLITNFASLSEAFAQKADSDDDTTIAPIINSKFQETAFQRSFNATAEDIANSSYDASILAEDGSKYLVGIKSFGINAGDQKVAQFKANSVAWTGVFEQMRENAQGKSKREIDEVNADLYLKMAKTISRLRNTRIRSSRAQLRGFRLEGGESEDVYHVLMPSGKGQDPKIYVGETSYSEIDIDNLKVLGTTGAKNPGNFRFTDGNHEYKYTVSDSQLYMTFNNKDIVVDSWDVNYIEDAFYVFENLGQLIAKDTTETKEYESYSWPIKVQPFSGFNAFYGSTKLKKDDREKRIQRLVDKYEGLFDGTIFDSIVTKLQKILLTSWKTTEDKFEMVNMREELIHQVTSLKDPTFTHEVSSMVFRPVSEMYIPITNSKVFHETHPDFFGKGIGTFKPGTAKLALPKEKRHFTLKMLPSGDEIEAYINQDNGKAIQSVNEQGILGEWILRKVFQLGLREPLTQEKLTDLGINGLKLSKLSEGVIGLEFIWSDEYQK